jgi:ABC-type Na+ efflux pump permease subunit
LRQQLTSAQEDKVSASTGSRLTTGRIAAAVILAIIAIAFLVVGVIFCVEPSGSLPGWLGHSTVLVGNKEVPSPGYHPLRAVGSLIVGVVFAIGAWFFLRYKTAPTKTGANTGSAAGVTPAR